MSFQYVLLILIRLCLCTQAAPLHKRAFSNGPVIAENFPDPASVEDNGTFYAFSTTNGRFNVPTASSLDFSTWTVTQTDALPSLPAWGAAPVWAPDVLQRPDGAFVLYFTALSRANNRRHCVGTAISAVAAGPYTPTADPLACPLDQGGAIDSAGFIDADGLIYVVYKIDSNSLGGGGACGNGDLARDTPIMLQQLASDGITPVGEPDLILSRDADDGPVIEAPSLVRSADGTYVLFFSSHCFNGPDYDVSYATASAVGGPYTKAAQPLLASGDDGGKLNSPGGADVSPDGRKLVFHADKAPGNAGVRQMWTADIEIEGGVVSVVVPVDVS